MGAPDDISYEDLLAKADALLKQFKPKEKRNRKKSGGKSSRGYAYAYDSEGNYRMRSHILMEEILGRPLKDHEGVTYRDGDKDNLAPENLTLRIKATHKGPVICPHCNKDVLE